MAKHLADRCHQYTQYSGVRPFGVALIISGVDRRGKLIYVTVPSGTFVSYSAVAIGAGADDVNSFLEKNYKDDMSLDDASALAIAAIELKSETKEEKSIKMSRITKDKIGMRMRRRSPRRKHGMCPLPSPDTHFAPQLWSQH